MFKSASIFHNSKFLILYSILFFRFFVFIGLHPMLLYFALSGLANKLRYSKFFIQNSLFFIQYSCFVPMHRDCISNFLFNRLKTCQRKPLRNRLTVISINYQLIIVTQIRSHPFFNVFNAYIFTFGIFFYLVFLNFTNGKIFTGIVRKIKSTY